MTVCLLVVNRESSLTVGSLWFFAEHIHCGSLVRGTRPNPQRRHHMRYTLLVRLALALLVLASIAVLAGDLPWGPN